MDHFWLFIFRVYIAALQSPAAKDWPLGSLICEVLLCFCQFLMWCPGSGVVLDCTDLCILTYLVTSWVYVLGLFLILASFSRLQSYVQANAKVSYNIHEKGVYRPIP